MDDKRSERIRTYMQEIFKLYNILRSKRTSGSESQSTDTSEAEVPPFWDIVVLTTFDATQKQCFEQQINIKKQHGYLPEVPILVVDDPVDQKLGVGGSTLHVVTELLKIYGNDVYRKKILIIHSGGSSQRLPSYSVLGKIFTPVPCKELMIDSTVPQMLDLKLAMYLPLCQMLEPGVFVTCADDIETYSLDLDALDLESLKSADVVALAHPSDVKTGEGHGVYVFESNRPECIDFVNSVQECVEVLQKPSEAVMREKAAVFMREDRGIMKEHVWSDSVFWLGERVCRSLVKWYANNSPLSSELDAYAHFLPCLGTRMKSAKPCDYDDFRSDMLPIFKDCSLKIILQNDSRFYHLGTMEEYLSHLTIIDSFSQELGLLKNISNSKMPFVYRTSELTENFPERVAVIDTHFGDSLPRITLQSEKSQVVIENCFVNVPFETKGNLILNNCTIKKCPSVKYLSDVVDLYDNLLYHTVPVSYEKQLLYVTVAFDLTADMKKSSKKMSDIFLYGCPLIDVIHFPGYTSDMIKTSNDSCISLWTARLFEGSYTPEESFWLTHSAVGKVLRHQNKGEIQTDVSQCPKSSSYFSMKDIVMYKALETFLKDREYLLTVKKS